MRGSRVQSFRLFAADAPAERCSCHVPVEVCVDSPILNADGEPVGRYHLAGELCPEESVKTVYMVDYERELASASVRIGDASALLSYYDSIPEERRYCDVHGEGWEPPEPPEPIESGDPQPGETDDPFLPPSQSYDPFVPPTAEPQPPQSSMEPPVVSEEPIVPPDDQSYIPADQWEGPEWSDG